MSDPLDLSDLPTAAVEREVGYLLREQLRQGSGLGCAVLQVGDRLVFLDPLVLLRFVELDALVPVLLVAGLSEGEAIAFLSRLVEGAHALSASETGNEALPVPGPEAEEEEE